MKQLESSTEWGAGVQAGAETEHRGVSSLQDPLLFSLRGGPLARG